VILDARLKDRDFAGARQFVGTSRFSSWASQDQFREIASGERVTSPVIATLFPCRSFRFQLLGPVLDEMDLGRGRPRSSARHRSPTAHA